MLIEMAELYRQRRYPDASDWLEDVWPAVDEGPYPLFAADAFIVLARIRRDAGDLENAVAAARQAYDSATCDGRPYGYYYGLSVTEEILEDLQNPLS